MERLTGRVRSDVFSGPQTPNYGHRVMSEQTPLLGHFMYRTVDLRAIENTRGLVRLQQSVLPNPDPYTRTHTYTQPTR